MVRFVYKRTEQFPVPEQADFTANRITRLDIAATCVWGPARTVRRLDSTGRDLGLHRKDFGRNETREVPADGDVFPLIAT
jgi:hypothetical protein